MTSRSDKPRAKKPWEKSSHEINHGDWLVAAQWHPEHMNNPRDLRCAAALAWHGGKTLNGTDPVVWPSQETIAGFMKVATTRQVQKAIERLKKSGAIKAVPIRDLPPDIRTGIKREGRGVAYQLNAFWAMEVFESEQLKTSKEPERLANSDKKIDRFARRKTELCRSGNTSESDASNPSDSDALQPVSVRRPKLEHRTLSEVRGSEQDYQDIAHCPHGTETGGGREALPQSSDLSSPDQESSIGEVSAKVIELHREQRQQDKFAAAIEGLTIPDDLKPALRKRFENGNLSKAQLAEFSKGREAVEITSQALERGQW